jgi:uncharacterized ferredoxin-like protein
MKSVIFTSVSSGSIISMKAIIPFGRQLKCSGEIKTEAFSVTDTDAGFGVPAGVTTKNIVFWDM